MERARSLMEMTSPETAEALKKTNLAIIPIGSVEQHGKHLPMGTDYYAAEALARRTASSSISSPSASPRFTWAFREPLAFGRRQ